MSRVLVDENSTQAGYDANTYADDTVIGALLEEWQFYRPNAELVRQILRLREELGDNYLDNEYERYGTTVPSLNHPDDAKAVPDMAEAISQKTNGIELMFAQLTGILGLNRKKQLESSDSNADAIAQYQSFISERIYNHLAMLGRTPRTLRGEAFSIRRELTEGIASKIGLGLYLSSEVHSDLREETERVLLQLAGDYQNWFLETTLSGAVEATWGDIYEAHQSLSKEQRDDYPLILKADVEEAAAAAR